MKSYSLLLLPAALLLIMGVSSCNLHFGRSAEEIINKYNDQERDIVFQLNTSQPDGSTGSRVSLVDNSLNGVTARWQGWESVALFDFGAVFYDGVDKKGGSPFVPALDYDREDDQIPDDDVDFASFSGTIHSKMGEGAMNGKQFALFFPYGTVMNLKSNATSTELDFEEQDGTLSNIAGSYMFAWGLAQGICEDGYVTFNDIQPRCNTDWHEHGAQEGAVILDNKMAIVRFSVLYQPTDEDGLPNGERSTLNEFLADSGLLIHHIEIENLEKTAGFSKAVLNLASGEVTEHPSASDSLTLTSPFGFLELDDIAKKDATPVSNEPDAERFCWGTTFYVSFPCPVNRTLVLHPMIKIYTCDAATHRLTSRVFYGLLGAHTMREGNYYMSSPVITTDSKAKLVESAKIYLYYHSSFVWGPTTIE